jgi:hypothetical protein
MHSCLNRFSTLAKTTLTTTLGLELYTYDIKAPHPFPQP